MCRSMGSELSEPELDVVFAKLDTDKSGGIDFDEFLVLWDVGLNVDSLLRLASVGADGAPTIVPNKPGKTQWDC